jgi:hypothetical protein
MVPNVQGLVERIVVEQREHLESTLGRLRPAITSGAFLEATRGLLGERLFLFCDVILFLQGLGLLCF